MEQKIIHSACLVLRHWAPMKGKKQSEHQKDVQRKRLSGKTLGELYGLDRAREIKEKQRQKALLRVYSKERNNKIRKALKGRTYLDIYGEKRAREISELKSVLRSEQILKGSIKYHTGLFFSNKNNAVQHYRSSYELAAMQMFENDSSIVKYEYEKIRIPYVTKTGYIRNTIPDFIVSYSTGERKLVEVKPQYVLKKHLWNIDDKLLAMKKYAKENVLDFSILTEKQLKQWLNKKYQ